jgi:hypothetical protein
MATEENKLGLLENEDSLKMIPKQAQNFGFIIFFT